jgi:phenylalanyl-tRNA synthetase beta chain
LETILHNVNRKMSNLRLFEFGKCYHYDASRAGDKSLAPYSEENHLGLWLTGKRVEGSWAHPDEASTVYELKAYIYNILRRLGLELRGLLIDEGSSDVFSKSLSIADRNGSTIVELGLVKKCLMPEIDQEVYYADIAWDVLMRKTRKNVVSFSEISKYPAVSRDLALLVDQSVTFSSIEQIARASEKKLLKSVTLFDVYEGKNLEAGKKSYAVNFTLQDETKTMNDKQTDAIMQKIIKNLEKQLGARLR